MPRFEAESTREARGLFRPIEISGGRSDLELLEGSWFAYAEGYREAADVLVERANTDRRRPSYLVFPIVFLYRHYLELSLKMLSIYLDRLHGVEDPPPTGHHLGRLWEGFHERLSAVPRYKSSFPGELRVIEHAVSDFTSLDATAQAFRYPADRDGETFRHPLPDIDLTWLREEVANLSVALSQIEAAVDAWLDEMAMDHRVWELFDGDFI